VLQLGDMVAELRTPGQDKGKAVSAFLREAPFNGAAPVFIGDDLTDEDGFAAAARLGGYGVLVGPERPTQATYRLNDFSAVLAWLGAAVDALGGRTAA
jgi:trehalose 6-phosphate phosphatase